MEGSGQLKIIDGRIKRMRGLFQSYQKGLSEPDFLELMPLDSDETVPWFMDIILRDVPRDRFIAYLREHDIGARPFYPPIHTQQPYSQAKGPFSSTEALAPEGVWLPSSIGLKDEEVERVITTITRFADVVVQ